MSYCNLLHDASRCLVDAIHCYAIWLGQALLDLDEASYGNRII